MKAVGSQTDVDEFLANVQPSFFTKLAYVLSEAAASQVMYGHGNRKCKVNIEFGFAQFGGEDQVMVSSKLSKSLMTSSGKKTEEVNNDQSFYVSTGGVMTINRPDENQEDQMRLREV